MPNDKLAKVVARAMCGSPEICPGCMEEAYGVIAAIRATPGWALVRMEGPEFEAAVDRAARAMCAAEAELGHFTPMIFARDALRAALSQQEPTNG